MRCASLTIVFDGYDLIVYGSAVPSLLAEPGWNLGPAQLGAVGSYALAGMLIGALGAGAVTDVIGRRKIMLIGITWFSVLMIACSLAPDPGLLGLLRFGAASFCGLLLVHGLNTWLPQIMRQAGYPLGSALTFLLVLNVGAIAGTIVASLLADRFGPKPVTVAAFLLATGSLLMLSQRVDTGLLFVAVAVAGLGSVGTQILINGYVAVHYPTAVRATALGWALGVGRAGAIVGPLFGGWVLASGIGFEWNFYGFAVPALVGAVLIALIPQLRRMSPTADAAEQAHAGPATPGNATTSRTMKEGTTA